MSAASLHRIGAGSPQRFRKSLVSAALLALLAAVLWGYIVNPMVQTFDKSARDSDGALTTSHYERFFDFKRGGQDEAIIGSIQISLLSVLFAGLIGVGLAVLLGRWEFPFRSLFQVVVMAPIALPPVIGVAAFDRLFGFGGTFPDLLAGLLNSNPNNFALRGMPGVLVVHAMTMYPLFYLTVSAALAQTDDSLEEAAYSLGASRFDAWRRVLLPMLTPAIVAGSLLTFMSSMASYTAPTVFTYDNVMTRQIFILKDYDQPLAAVVAVVLTISSMAFLVAMRIYEQRTIFRTQSKGGGRKRHKLTNPTAKTILLIVASISSAFVILPIAMIFLLAFSVDRSWRTGPWPSQYTLQNFADLFSKPGALTPIRNSLEMSAIAVTGVIVLGVATAYVLAKMQFHGRAVLDIVMMLPWALPGTVVALNLITSFSTPSIFSFGNVLIGTFWIFPLAYFVRFSPLVFRSTSASLAQLDPAVEEAARSLGASWWCAFRRVVLPLLSRGIAAGAVLAFVDGIGEFVASTMLVANEQFRPLSVAIHQEYFRDHWGTAAAWGVVQVLLVVILLIVAKRLEKRTPWLNIS